MNEKSLEKNLANLERELVNLQTAHDVGLGNVRYWQYSGVAKALYNDFICYMAVQVKGGEPLNPVLNFYVDTEVAGVANVIKSATYEDRYLLWAVSLASGTSRFNFKLVSTSQVSYWELATPEEAEAWLGTY